MLIRSLSYHQAVSTQKYRLALAGFSSAGGVIQKPVFDEWLKLMMDIASIEILITKGIFMKSGFEFKVIKKERNRCDLFCSVCFVTCSLSIYC